MWYVGSSSLTRVGTWGPALVVQNHSHQTTREGMLNWLLPWGDLSEQAGYSISRRRDHCKLLREGLSKKWERKSGVRGNFQNHCLFCWKDGSYSPTFRAAEAPESGALQGHILCWRWASGLEIESTQSQPCRPDPSWVWVRFLAVVIVSAFFISLTYFLEANSFEINPN